jgi:hypothetical protein
VDLPLEEAWTEDTAIALAFAHADPFPDFPQKLVIGDVYVNALAFTLRLRLPSRAENHGKRTFVLRLKRSASKPSIARL